MIWIILGVSGWIGCGVIGAGLWNAAGYYLWPSFYRTKLKAKAQMREALGTSLLFGPFGLPAILMFTMFGAYGWTLSSEPINPK